MARQECSHWGVTVPTFITTLLRLRLCAQITPQVACTSDPKALRDSVGQSRKWRPAIAGSCENLFGQNRTWTPGCNPRA